MAPPKKSDCENRSKSEPYGPLVADYSPEARRRAALSRKTGFRKPAGLTRFYLVVRRVALGTWNDGFIHAGNLAYMSMLAIFPFFIIGAAGLSLLGEASAGAASITSVLSPLPSTVRKVIEPVVEHGAAMHSGWLLWIGGLVGLWTAGSLVETVRDILRRAYGTPPTLSFWHYRLISTAFIIAAVLLLLASLFLQVAIVAAHEVIGAWMPQLDSLLTRLSISRIFPPLGLFLSLEILFVALTPASYRSRRYPKWPGALATTLWAVAAATALPRLLKVMVTYDVTYGSLAGIMISLFFFWLIGLGIVVGAELNAALARTPEEEGVDGMVLNNKEETGS